MLILSLAVAVSNAGEPDKKHNKRGLLDVGYSDHGGGFPVVPFGLGHGGTGLRSGSEGIGSSGIQVTTISREVPFPVPQPVPVTVNRVVPIPVPVPYAVSIPRPVPVPVPQPVPFTVVRPVPVTINRPIPVPIARPVPVPVPQPYVVHIPRAVPVQVPHHFPVLVPKPITIAVPQYVVVSSGGGISSGGNGRGFHGGSGIFSGFHGSTIERFHGGSLSLTYDSEYGHSIKG